MHVPCVGVCMPEALLILNSADVVHTLHGLRCDQVSRGGRVMTLHAWRGGGERGAGKRGGDSDGLVCRLRDCAVCPCRGGLAA